MTARGVYEPLINGRRVGDDAMAPGWTDYHARQPYQTFDVTDVVVEGHNVLSATLGTGWYAGSIGWEHQSRHYGTQPQFLARLEVDHADGESTIIVTDRNWVYRDGPIRYSDFLAGEFYDARAVFPTVDAAHAVGPEWVPVVASAPSNVPLVPEQAPPMRALEIIEPVSRTERSPDVVIFDLGQNIAGWARLTVRGEAGSTVTIRYAERLDDDGSLYVANLRAARAIDTYIFRGVTRKSGSRDSRFMGSSTSRSAARPA